MKEEYFKWYSPNLNREIGCFWTFWIPCDSISYFNGSYHENKDMGLIESAKWYIEQGLIQIFCPDSIDKDSFYNKQIYPIHRIENVRYDKMICHEIVEK
jgi:esterase/lipase superfamily enzyme